MENTGFNEKLTKRNNVQYEGKNKFKKISLCTLIHVFEHLSSNEVSGVRLNNSQRTVMTAREVAVYTSVEFGLAGGGAAVQNTLRIG